MQSSKFHPTRVVAAALSAALVLSVAAIEFSGTTASAATQSSRSVAAPAAAAVVTPKALLGMSSPADLWDKRVSEVGTGLQARRLFFTGFDASLSLATKACAAGMYPVMSFKTGSYSLGPGRLRQG